MSEYEDLLYEVDSHVATITLNRPDRLNAISQPMLESFSRALRDADADRDVRVIIITGAGRGFCAGLDLKELGGERDTDTTGVDDRDLDLASGSDLGRDPERSVHRDPV